MERLNFLTNVYLKNPSRPTFFELNAKEQMSNSLSSALDFFAQYVSS